MADDEQAELEELEDVMEANFKALGDRVENIQEEMRNSKPKQNISVRRVDSENLEGQDEDQIVVEHSVQRWYSINYFKKMLQNSEGDSENASDSSSEENDEETLF